MNGRLSRQEIKPIDPVEWMKQARRRRAPPCAAARLAALPPWDGKVRFYRIGHNGRIDAAPWSDAEIHALTWEALRAMAAGNGLAGSKNDPNDPPIVGQDIRAHPNNPWR